MGKKKALAVHLLFIHAHPPHSLSTSRHSRRQAADNQQPKFQKQFICHQLEASHIRRQASHSESMSNIDPYQNPKPTTASTSQKNHTNLTPRAYRTKQTEGANPTMGWLGIQRNDYWLLWPLHCYWVIISLLLRCLTT
jgi:hypothetical protein